MIASLTGVSHERLIVFHNWVAWAMLVLALIHTFPFIVHHVWKGDMVMQWNTGLVYWSGIAALIPQAYLTFMSLPYIRYVMHHAAISAEKKKLMGLMPETHITSSSKQRTT